MEEVTEERDLNLEASIVCKAYNACKASNDLKGIAHKRDLLIVMLSHHYREYTSSTILRILEALECNKDVPDGLTLISHIEELLKNLKLSITAIVHNLK